jgi:serine/threonine-protein kinase
MTSSRPTVPDDARLAGLLDAYLSELQAGRQPDKNALLAQHPQLARALECLQALDSLSQPSGHDSSQKATVAWQPQDSGDGEELPARVFGDYELLAELGRGGMGVVYKARQVGLNRTVALKMILSSHFASEAQVHRFQAEARAAARMCHPHIVQIYEVNQLEGQHYFAMQYVEGPTLARRLSQGPMPVEEGLPCLIALARAVAYLHGQGIVHRDLKPSNVLLGPGNWPYIADFGLAKTLQGDSRMTGSAIVGTPSYMSPEQAAARHGEVGPRSDVYSLGAILYEILAGQPPFHEASPLDTLVQVLENEPVLPSALHPEVPHELEMICSKCLAKSPDDRYASAAELADDLERFTRGEAILARPQTFWQRWVRWMRQEPGLASRLGLVALISLVAQVNYELLHHTPLRIQVEVQLLLAGFAVLSIICQGLIRRNRRPDLVRHIWLGVDGIILTAVLWRVDAVYSPVLIAFSLYIVASGLWFRVGLVWFTTGMAIAGYLVLVGEAATRDALGPNPHFHIHHVVGLVALGLMVSYQVQRVRALSRYYEHRSLP